MQERVKNALIWRPSGCACMVVLPGGIMHVTRYAQFGCTHPFHIYGYFKLNSKMLSSPESSTFLRGVSSFLVVVFFLFGPYNRCSQPLN